MDLDLIVHADWDGDPKKRWLARAQRQNGRYPARAPERVSNLPTLLPRLTLETAGEGYAIADFDFPIGLPRWYAKRADIRDFAAFSASWDAASGRSSSPRPSVQRRSAYGVRSIHEDRRRAQSTDTCYAASARPGVPALRRRTPV